MDAQVIDQAGYTAKVAPCIRLYASGRDGMTNGWTDGQEHPLTEMPWRIQKAITHEPADAIDN